jgi:hypothetical protein
VIGDKLIDLTDMDETIQAITENEFLFRLGFVTELLMLASFLGLGLGLYQMYRIVGQGYAKAMLVFIAVSVAAMTINTIHYMAVLWLIVPSDSLLALTEEHRQLGVLFLLQLHRFGYTASQLYFGLWLFPLGVLVYRGQYFPNYWRQFVGIFLMLGCFSYLVDLSTLVLVPGVNEALPTWIEVIPDIGEFGLCLSLLVFGNRFYEKAALTGRESSTEA